MPDGVPLRRKAQLLIDLEALWEPPTPQEVRNLGLVAARSRYFGEENQAFRAYCRAYRASEGLDGSDEDRQRAAAKELARYEQGEVGPFSVAEGMKRYDERVKRGHGMPTAQQSRVLASAVPRLAGLAAGLEGLGPFREDFDPELRQVYRRQLQDVRKVIERTYRALAVEGER